MKSTAKQYFKIEFSGGESENKELTVKDLAPALIAFSDFLDQANSVINGKRVKVDLKFKASSEGSIIVELGLHADILTQIVDFFSGDAVAALLNLKEVIGLAGGSGYGIFKLIKWLKNRKIQKVKLSDGKKVVLILEDGDSIEITENELNVLKSIKARKYLSEFKKPLLTGSADEILIYDEKTKRSIENGIDTDTASYFDPPDVADELLLEKEQELVITIESLSFKEGNKWRVSDGNNTFTATISDDNFINDVQDNREAFRRDDILRVKMTTKQYKTGTGLKTDHEITEVKEHIPPPDQLNIVFE
ncbi:hypothetical protein [Rhodohalobacter sp. 8-1]|uniref:hypothetical protein n=1 Tax=Rhodohalobacter sp. 8-1 TaxID=3131972 RepID=UPI0030ECBDB0